MAAIATAHLGKDFVIFGPPGTGKSQTIANLIAHALGERKTVLFVSSKIEALRVVHDRLEKIGLGRFCLELHSNKARKADVRKRLEKSWEESGRRSPAAWQQTADEITVLRDRLNRVSTHLHRVHSQRPERSLRDWRKGAGRGARTACNAVVADRRLS